jgi:hypothetical protein
MKSFFILVLISVIAPACFGNETQIWPAGVIAEIQGSPESHGVKFELVQPSVLILSKNKHLIRVERTSLASAFLVNTKLIDLRIIRTTDELRRALAGALPKIAVRSSLWISSAFAAQDADHDFMEAMVALMNATITSETCPLFTNLVKTCMQDVKAFSQSIAAGLSDQKMTAARDAQLAEIRARMENIGESLGQGTDFIFEKQATQNVFHQCSCKNDGIPKNKCTNEVPGSLVTGLGRCVDEFNQMKLAFDKRGQQRITELTSFIDRLSKGPSISGPASAPASPKRIKAAE